MSKKLLIMCEVHPDMFCSLHSVLFFMKSTVDNVVDQGREEFDGSLRDLSFTWQRGEGSRQLWGIILIRAEL